MTASSRRPRAGMIGLTLLASSLAAGSTRAQWTAQEGRTDARLRGLSVVDSRVAWASGSKGTILRTTDGGRTWQNRTVPGGADLDFRDIHAFDDRTAYVLSIGEGEKSRISKTVDGGATWTLQHVNRSPKGFLDAIAFLDVGHGLALGDPVAGRYVILATDDGGTTWKPTPIEGMPSALPGEGAFAASGTCLVVGPDGHAWFGTGGAKVGRVFRSTDRGRTWTAHETPIAAGSPSSGVFSLAFADAEHGIAVGGDYKEPARARNLVALTADGGQTWRPPSGSEPGGYRSAVAIVPGTRGRMLVAVGPTGSDASIDGGESWRRLGTTGFNAVQFVGPAAGWAAGDGLIAGFRGKLLGLRHRRRHGGRPRASTGSISLVTAVIAEPPRFPHRRSRAFARGVEPTPGPGGFDCTSGQAGSAGAGGRAVGIRMVSPADDLPGRADAEDLVAADRPGDDDLETASILRSYQDPDGPAHGHLPVPAVIVAEPGGFVGREAKIHGRHRPPARSSLQLAEPLVRGEIVGQDRHAEHARGRPVGASRRPDAGTADRPGLPLGRQVGQDRHGPGSHSPRRTGSGFRHPRGRTA